MKIGIIGAGASGLVCAITAARQAKQLKAKVHITVFEANDRAGKKILVTGNGRCNMLNTDSSPFYFSDNNFHEYAITKYNAKSNLEFFNSMGLYTRTDSEGRVYPLSNQATTVLNFLRKECELLNIEIKTDYRITKISKAKNGFVLNDEMMLDRVVLATGGKASVKSFNGYELLSQLHHPLTTVSPSLTKVKTKSTSDVKPLQGIKQKCSLTLYNKNNIVAREKGELLFTKYGISGIAVMQLSAYITRYKDFGSFSISADFVPDFSVSQLTKALTTLIKHNKCIEIGDLLSGFMPKKLSETVIRSVSLNITDNANTLTENKLSQIAQKAKNYIFYIDSLCGFEESQVTCGGADTRYFNSKTMESKKVDGLYAIGEVLDVDGLCGGYNLMWAWSSARLCGENIVKNKR